MKKPTDFRSSSKSRSLISAWLAPHRSLEAEDRELVDALRQSPPSAPTMGDFERHSIEQAWQREAARRPEPDESATAMPWKGWASVAVAVVAACAAWIVWAPVEPSAPIVEKPMQSAPVVANGGTDSVEPSAIPSTRPSAAEGGSARPVVAWAARLDEPLASEQQRLLADMKGALRYVAASVLPDPVLNEVDQAIGRIETDGEET